MRRRENDPRRQGAAIGAVLREFVFGHRSHVGEGAAFGTEIIVDGHDFTLISFRLILRSAPKVRVSMDEADVGYLSGDIGISTPPLMCLIGPAALGITSKSKMSVGSHNVAQAFGISTTPEI